MKHSPRKAKYLGANSNKFKKATRKSIE